MSTSFDVKLWDPTKRKDRKKRPWRLRWSVAAVEQSVQFETKAAADSRKAEFKIALNRGEPFDIETGLPVSELRELQRQRRTISCLELMKRFADSKWENASAHHRANIAEVCMWASIALLPAVPDSVDGVAVRRSLRRWAFNYKQRHDAPVEAVEALKWVESHIPSAAVFEDARKVETTLAAMQQKFDGKTRSSHCRKRARTILSAVCDFAVKEGLLDVNHVKAIKPERVKTSESVDVRRVANPQQVERFLGNVRRRKPNGWRYVPYFAVQGYGALRPEEAIALHAEDLDLPKKGGWGRLHLHKSASHVGSAWTDSGEVRDDRGLKQRDREFIRTAPCPPQLTAILADYLKESGFKPGPEGQLFVRADGELLAECTVRRVFHDARGETFGKNELKTPLLKRPYDLRHTCVSTWLHAGVPVTQVAEWAGHSVAVLLRIYAKCLDGQDEAVRMRIEKTLTGG
ncbi:tyrosine-type recombinase/integrase [Glycomyces arizonensis]|uniref:tyrosine-type recombinase/integrase n=1 Tax=Glycomyces arizonensis TaxID=256035 RepID=UPI0004122F98|nr:tyrosine-type recombinase/integrase [Glycomyces arizonensis]